MSSRQFWVYLLASKTRRLYVGITNDRNRRIFEHQSGAIPGFTRRYGITRLVYIEVTGNPRDAITREKQIKAWLRAKKVALIESQNPMWLDLAAPMVGEGDPADPSLRSG